MPNKKPKRIWTNRDFPNGKDYECIELDENGHYFWKAEENGMYAQFPICHDSIQEIFKKQGRTFIPDSKSHDYLDFAKANINSPLGFVPFL